MIYYILNIILISFILYLIWKLKAEQLLSKEAYSFAVMLKIGFAIFSVFYYENGDIKYFHWDSTSLVRFFFEDNKLYWNILFFDNFTDEAAKDWLFYWTKPRAFFMGKFLSPFSLITNCNVYLNAVYLSLINLFSILFLASKIKIFANKYFNISILILLFLPSIVFNTSGLEKEVLVMAGIYLIIAFGLSLYHKKVTVFDFIMLVLGLFLVYKIKYYYLAVLGPLGVSFLVSHLISNRYVKYSIGAIVILILSFYSKLIHPYLDPFLAFQSTIEANHSLILRSGIGMNTPFYFTDYSIFEFAKNLPLAIVYGLFGSFFWEFKNIAMFYIGLENLVIFSATMLFVYKVITKQIKWTYFGTVVLLYVLTLAVILSFYSPNFGTLTRYKVSFLPFMLIFIFHHTIENKISKLPVFKKIFK